MGSSNNPIVMTLNDPSDPWTDHTCQCWPLGEHSFGVCTGTPFCDFYREFSVLVSAVTGSVRTLAPGVDVVLEVVRMAVN